MIWIPRLLTCHIDECKEPLLSWFYCSGWAKDRKKGICDHDSRSPTTFSGNALGSLVPQANQALDEVIQALRIAFANVDYEGIQL